MPISSVIVGVTPGTETETHKFLEGIPFVEVQQVGEGKIIITLDTPDLNSDTNTLEFIRNQPLAKTVATVFSNMEDLVDK